MILLTRLSGTDSSCNLTENAYSPKCLERRIFRSWVKKWVLAPRENQLFARSTWG
jgi:hypothetical protein